MKLKSILILFMVLGLNTNCAIFKKSHKESRATASLSQGNAYSTRRGRPLNKERQKTELLRRLKKGQAVLSKGVVIQEGQAFCSFDLKNQRYLTPSFSRPIPKNFRSSVSLNKDIRSCNRRETNNLAQLQKHFVAEGTQTALVPFVFGVGIPLAGLFGCVARIFSDTDRDLLAYAFGITGPAVAAAGASATAMIERSKLPGTRGVVVEKLSKSPKALARATGAAGLVAASAVAGYMICGTLDNNVSYVIEDISNFVNNR